MKCIFCTTCEYKVHATCFATYVIGTLSKQAESTCAIRNQPYIAAGGGEYPRLTLYYTVLRFTVFYSTLIARPRSGNQRNKFNIK